MTKHIALSTKQDYALTFILSETLNIIGYDAFIYVDFARDTITATPQVNLIGFTVSAYAEEPKVTINVGDQVKIGDTVYELVSKRTKYIGNGDLTLVPVN